MGFKRMIPMCFLLLLAGCSATPDITIRSFDQEVSALSVLTEDCDGKAYFFFASNGNTLIPEYRYFIFLKSK